MNYRYETKSTKSKWHIKDCDRITHMRGDRTASCEIESLKFHHAQKNPRPYRGVPSKKNHPPPSKNYQRRNTNGATYRRVVETREFSRGILAILPASKGAEYALPLKIGGRKPHGKRQKAQTSGYKAP